MARRGENIFKRADGRWEARFIHHRDAAGKAVYRYIYGKTYKEAKERRQIAQSEPDQVAKRGDSEPTLSSLCNGWLADVRVSVKEATYTRYYRAVMKYILPHLGEESLCTLDVGRINAFSEQLLRSGGLRGASLSPKTVTDILSVLKCALRFGMLSGKVNLPIDCIRLPKKESKRIDILDEDSRAFLEARVVKGEDYVSVGILLSLFTGLRLGELCALRWGDVDLEARALAVSRTVERIADLTLFAPAKTKLVLSEPKTHSSVRIIPLPHFVCECLRRYKAKKLDTGACLTPESFVLTGNEGVCEPHRFYMRYKRAMRSLGLGGYTFHALRHTFATRCVEAGFDTKSLAEILGHANVSTTLSIYVHPTLTQKRAQMEKLQLTAPAGD